MHRTDGMALLGRLWTLCPLCGCDTWHVTYAGCEHIREATLCAVCYPVDQTLAQRARTADDIAQQVLREDR